jgi:hypothetical protein
MAKQRLTLIALIEDDGNIPSVEEWTKDFSHMLLADVDTIESISLTNVCNWPNCTHPATHPGAGKTDASTHTYCDDHCVGGG